LQWAVLLSVFFFMLAGAADEQVDWLYWLIGGLMGFVAALFFGIFGVGFVALWNLWKELIAQLKKAKVGSLLLSVPLAVLWLGLGLGVFLLLGILVEKIEKFAKLWQSPLQESVWILIAIVFYGLWKGRSHAALMLRLILIISFSAIMLVAVAFGYWWIISETTLLLVLLLSAIGTLNVVFYCR